jgi:hypothetical protein
MIDFNITIVAQAAHFLFAWWALSRFLFRPVVAAVQKEQALQKRLHTVLKKEEQFLQDIKKEQEREWARYQRQFKNNVPALQSHLVMSGVSLKRSPLVEISKQEEEKAISAVVELVVQRIGHD